MIDYSPPFDKRSTEELLEIIGIEEAWKNDADEFAAAIEDARYNLAHPVSPWD